jgi:hypothetical protein
MPLLIPKHPLTIQKILPILTLTLTRMQNLKLREKRIVSYSFIEGGEGYFREP